MTHATWFGGIYQDPNKGFQGVFQAPVEPEELPARCTRSSRSAPRTRSRPGSPTATGVDRRPHDRRPLRLEGRRPDPDPGHDLAQEGRLAALGVQHRRHLRRREKGTDTTQFLFHYDYFDEARAVRPGDRRLVHRADRRPDEGGGGRQARSTRSSPTRRPRPRPSTEKAFAQGFANQIGNIGAHHHSGSSPRSSSPCCSSPATPWRSRCASAPASSRCSRRSASPTAQVLGLVLAESCLLAIARRRPRARRSARWRSPRGDPTGGFLPIFYFPTSDRRLGRRSSSSLLGLVAGILPAVQAMRLRIVDALRRA